MMDRRQYERAFEKNHSNLKYTEALEVIGAMKYENIPRTRYNEMLIYYEQGEFEKIRRALKGKKLDNLEERELYLASLVELQLDEEFERAYNPSDAMSGSCLYYIEGKRKKQGREMPAKQEEVMDYPTYFDLRYRWFMSDRLTEIYNMNEMRLMMIDAGMPASETDEASGDLDIMLDMFRFNDSLKSRLKKHISDNEHIPEDLILYYPIMHALSTYEPDRIFRRYDSLTEIALFLRMCRRIDGLEAEMQAVEVYWNELAGASKDGSMIITDLLKYLYADLGYLREYGFGYRYADRLRELLEKEAPNAIEEMDEHTVDKELMDTLSIRGKVLYRSSCWQLCDVMRKSLTICDPECVCRAYILLLQLEINERILWPLRDRNNIGQKYEDFKSKLEKLDAGRFEKEWKYLISGLTETGINGNKQAGFGVMYALFNSLKFKRYKKDSADREFAGEIRSCMEDILTEEGMTALADGTLARMTEPKIWERFRQTAGGTRYTEIENVIKCRRYIEESLSSLALYVRNLQEVENGTDVSF